MMNRHRLITFSLAACLGLFSCKKDNGAPADQSLQHLIVGKWTLQQQQFVQYADGVKKMDTLLNATQFSLASIQFNNDGTFTSSSAYTPGNTGNLGTSVTNVSDSSNGTYSFTGTVFNISAPISGFSIGSGMAFGTTGSVPVITPVSHLAQISVLTSSKLNLHTEYSYSYTVNNVTQVYKMVDDYYYTK